MQYFTVAVVMASVASASVVARQNDCTMVYNACLAAGTPQVACGCLQQTCLGEDNARGREYCAAVSASLLSVAATATSKTFSGICNAAAIARGDCTATAAIVPTPTEAAPAAASTDCEKVRSDCQSQPGANQSYCASLFVKCAGTTSGLNKDAPAPTPYVGEPVVFTGPEPSPSVYVGEPVVFTGPEPTPSVYVGEPVVFTGPEPTPSVYVGEPVVFTASSAYPAPSAPADCEKVRSDCQSKPDANQSYCASLYVKCSGTTSGLNKPGPAPTTPAKGTGASTTGMVTYTGPAVAGAGSVKPAVGLLALGALALL
ncbi:uncharacterized protein L3040_005102 [Drepanopeziza brunnea f. sp. 'multigermtubi']|uniref:uncharacterized protein n=1 Tax=Drepanopeziza brunnea f. sp. 'multigermtubi' TaxID=698441 RepID=UPI0023A0B660|nr:hypothetical protein L3040_005102 [Drepanopeziza brunnea f. sp. 'multigermtubi']